VTDLGEHERHPTRVGDEQRRSSACREHRRLGGAHASRLARVDVNALEVKHPATLFLPPATHARKMVCVRVLVCLWLVTVAWAACDGSGAASDAVGDGAGGPCDAPPIAQCGSCGPDDTCVLYDSESGFPSCTDYDRCIDTALDCPPGACTTECETALCPRPYTCDPTATTHFRCIKP
jgi:hypothetical protein